MPSKIRVTNIGDAVCLHVQTIRQDVGGGEPQVLASESELQPGESSIFAVYTGCAVVISRKPPKDKSRS